MNKRALILSIPMILAVFLFGGWLVLRGQRADQESQKSPVVAENSVQPMEKNLQEIQTPDTTVDTSDWKTYRNEEYGFELKYPPVETGWTLEEYDYSKNSELPYWPARGISIFYNPNQQGNYLDLRGLDFIFNRSRFGSGGSVYPIGSKYTYTFDFQGKKASAFTLDRGTIESFFSQQKCEDIYFELPNFSSLGMNNKKESEPLTVSFICRKSQASKESMQIYINILRSVHFFR